MKIAISSTGQNMDSMVDPRFGRAAGFIIYNTETSDCDYVSNGTNMSAPQGAGIQAAKTVADSGATAVLTGNCGPKAFTALKSAGIKIYVGIGGTISDAVEKFNKGDIQETVQANVQGHWM